MIWQSVLVVVICYLYIYLDFSYIYLLFVFAGTMIIVNKDYQMTIIDCVYINVTLSKNW